MKINSINEVRGYEAPYIEVCEVIAERGFEASLPFGEEGYAGQDGNVFDYDDEL